jgi:hypothetical protein
VIRRVRLRGDPDQALIDFHDFIQQGVSTEDYSVAKEGQPNLQYAPVDFQIVYGRNEIALQNVHRSLAAMTVYPHVTLEIHAAPSRASWKTWARPRSRSWKAGLAARWRLDPARRPAWQCHRPVGARGLPALRQPPLKAFAADPNFPTFKNMLTETVISETVVFVDKAPHMS